MEKKHVINSSQNSKSSSLNPQKMPSREEHLSDKHRIGFLNQCKLELSAEVIRWKEESVKLRKENDAALKQIEELQSYAGKLSRKNRELETSLFLSWEENKRLRKRTRAIGEENSALHEKLSKSKYYSYPNLELNSSSNGDTPSTTNSTQTWEKVSQELFRQMQKEICEMQKLSLNFNDGEKVPVCSTSKLTQQEDCEVVADLPEAELDGLVSQSNVLKQHLRVQSEKLRILLDSISQEVEQQQHKKNENKQSVLKALSSNSKEAIEEEKIQCRPSDETFRAYFTQQLTKSASEEKKISHVYLNQDSVSPSDVPSKSTPISRSKTVTSNVVPIKKDSPKTDDKKLCPICKMAFPNNILDKDFEAHVIAHLETVGATLLDHYEVI